MYKVIYKQGEAMKETILQGQYAKDLTVKRILASGAKIVRTVRVA